MEFLSNDSTEDFLWTWWPEEVLWSTISGRFLNSNVDFLSFFLSFTFPAHFSALTASVALSLLDQDISVRNFCFHGSMKTSRSVAAKVCCTSSNDDNNNNYFGVFGIFFKLLFLLHVKEFMMKHLKETLIMNIRGYLHLHKAFHFNLNTHWACVPDVLWDTANSFGKN